MPEFKSGDSEKKRSHRPQAYLVYVQWTTQPHNAHPVWYVYRGQRSHRSHTLIEIEIDRYTLYADIMHYVVREFSGPCSRAWISRMAELTAPHASLLGVYPWYVPLPDRVLILAHSNILYA